MNVSVIGCGYLGAVHAACMASLGHTVIGVERDHDRIEALRRGEPPFYEPGLARLLSEGRASGRLTFTDDLSAVRDCTVHFVCVGTPQHPETGAADLRALDSVVTAMLPLLRPGHVVVGKSTVPVGTAARLARVINDACHGADLVWNPEFLRESTAVQDTMRPDRLVYGVDPAAPAERQENAARVLDRVYASLLQDGVPRLVTDHATAELVKVAANSFLATKISFINSMAEICHLTGGDVDVLADAIGMDRRIGREFLDAGLGFGGGCLPKDIRAFRSRSLELGATAAAGILEAVDTANANTSRVIGQIVCMGAACRGVCQGCERPAQPCWMPLPSSQEKLVPRLGPGSGSGVTAGRLRGGFQCSSRTRVHGTRGISVRSFRSHSAARRACSEGSPRCRRKRSLRALFGPPSSEDVVRGQTGPSGPIRSGSSQANKLSSWIRFR
jgi:nucleotide sugar dehydrogenase